MKKILLFVCCGMATLANAQVEIEPFAPSVPGTYIGDFSGVTPLSSVTGSTAWTSEGTGTGPYAFVGDDGANLFSYTGSVGNYCAAGFDVGQSLILVSPEMDFGTNTNNPTLTFKWGQSQYFPIGPLPTGYCVQTLEVLYKEGVGGSWNNLITITTLDGSYIWHDEIIDLSVVSDFSQLYIGFKVTSTTPGSLYPTANYGQTVFDEIVITGESCTPSTNTFSVSVCDGYTVPSGDETYTTLGSQTVMDTIPNSMGCDSVLTINLTINTTDPSVTDNGDGTLTANAAGATYVWLENCNTTPTVMAGETSQTLNPGADGYYSCVVTENGCSDTSACTQVVFFSMDEQEKSFAIFPNPSSGEITIDLTGISGQQQLIISDINGKMISNEVIAGGSIHNMVLNLDQGIYMISLTDHENNIRRSRLIIE